jgi:hypothetical protein
LGILAAFYFKYRSSRRHFAYFAVAGTLLYDALTGLTTGPLLFHQPLFAAALGQIPFTLMHLLGNVSFALLLSPVLMRLLTRRAVSDTLPALLVSVH